MINPNPRYPRISATFSERAGVKLITTAAYIYNGLNDPNDLLGNIHILDLENSIDNSTGKKASEVNGFKYVLAIGREEYTGNDLSELEEILFRWLDEEGVTPEPSFNEATRFAELIELRDQIERDLNDVNDQIEAFKNKVGDRSSHRTQGAIEALQYRLTKAGFEPMDEEDLWALTRWDNDSRAMLEDFAARLGIKTDDIIEECITNK